MVRPSRRGRMRALLTSEESTGVADGDNVDWDEGGIFDPGTGSKDQWKQPVRVASTASVTVSTALNAGDTIDGVTLVAGDRVLLKDQSTGSQNGIYVAGATPARAADMDDDAEVMGSLVYVIAGTANGGKAYKNTNTSLPTVGSTSLTFTEFGAGGSSSFATPAIVLGSSAAAGAASTVIRSDSTIAAFDATVPVTQAFSDTAATGSAAFAARRDHKHGMPANPGGGSAGALVLLSSSVLGADAASISVTGLSGSYQDLIVVAHIRSAVAAAIDNLYMRVGSGSIDTGSNYDEFSNYNGSGTGNFSSTGSTRGAVAVCAGATATAGYFTAIRIEIIDYASTSHVRMMFGQSFNSEAANRYRMEVGIGWRNTSGALDQVQMLTNASNIKSGSKLYVYGRG